MSDFNKAFLLLLIGCIISFFGVTAVEWIDLNYGISPSQKNVLAGFHAAFIILMAFRIIWLFLEE